MTATSSLGTSATEEATEPALDTKTKKVSGVGRRKLYQLRDFLQDITQINRCRKCGRVPVERVPTVHIAQSNEGQARYQGVILCHSLWMCPVCSDRIARKRAANLADLLARWAHANGGLCFQTLTIPHSIENNLKETVSAVTRGFRGVLSGRAWHQVEADFGIAGHVRVLEVTVGPNGWHPHVHILFFTKKSLTSRQLSNFQQRIYSRFSRTIQNRGFPQPDPRNCPLKTVQGPGVGAYLAKIQAAAELTCWHTKKGRKGNRTPFQVLDDAMTNAEPRDLALWAEWEETMPGRRQMNWSKGFEKALKALPAASSEAESDTEESRTVARISHALWGRIRSRRGLDFAVLEAIESGGYEEAALLLQRTVGQGLDNFDLHFIRHIDPPPVAPLSLQLATRVEQAVPVTPDRQCVLL